MRMPDTFDLIMTVSANVLKNDIGEVCFTCENTKELVHCKDCAHHFGKFCWCSELRCYMEDDDFCSKAERKNA